MTRARRASGVAFITAAVMLFTQVLVHRLVSAKLMNNYAFLVISLTMLGLATSGVALVRWLPTFLEHLSESLVGCSALFCLTIPLTSWIFCRAASPIPSTGRADFVIAFLQTVPVALVFAVPFFFLGLMLGALLSDASLSTPTIYFADLIGSATGALAVIPALRVVGVETGLLLGAAVLLAVTLTLERTRLAWTRGLAAFASVALASSWVAQGTVFALRPQVTQVIERVADRAQPYGLEYVAWDAVARIEVSRIRPLKYREFNYPCLIGGNTRFHGLFQRMLTQNNYAFTYALAYDGNRETLKGIEETIYSAAYHTTSTPAPKVLIIGVGGGFDVLTALYFGAADITGVEVNAATLKILTQSYKGYFGPWVSDPRVHLIGGEGRQTLEESSSGFDILQISGVDSYSGTAAAANVFSENYLYTAEAFDLYLSRLNDGGILNMMRLEYSPPREMLRALTTAVAALRRAGAARPADHIAMLTSREGNFTALLVKKTPFSRAELARLGEWANGSSFFRVSAAPSTDALLQNPYQAFLAQEDPKREAAFISLYPWDISPVTDDRPFFFKYSFLWHLATRDPLLVLEAPVLEYSALLLLFTVGLVATATIFLPLGYLSRTRARPPRVAGYALYFAGTGVGYLAIEVGLLQKFGLFLGHPNYSLSVVLAGLLFATGIGSLTSRRVLVALRSIRFVGYGLAAVLLGEALVVMPQLARWVTLPFPIRVAVVLVLIFPIGLLLGTYVPTALERLKKEAPALVPWAWGINGIFSVLAPILAIWLSTSWGMTALLIGAIPIYLIVGLSLAADSSPLPRDDRGPALAGQ